MSSLPSDFTSAAAFEPNPGDVSVLGAVNIILRHWLLAVSVMIGLVAIVIGVVAFTPRTYSSRMSVAPTSRKGSSAVPGASLAAQFGISIPNTDATNSPQFYVDLLHSREILGPVVDSSYQFRLDGRLVRQNLIGLFSKGVRDPRLRRQEAIKRLGANVTSSISAKTNVISLAVKSPSPELSYQIALQILQTLNVFNLEQRHTEASAERRFTEQLVGDAEAQLRAAEDRQQQFFQENKDWRMSPRLSLQGDRLARDVNMRQQVYTSLAQAAEQAKIDEVRDTPLLSLVERPDVAILPDSRGGVIKVAIALLGGLLLGALAAFLREMWIRSKAQPSQDRNEFDTLRKQMAQQLRHPVKSTLEGRASGPRASP